MNATRVLMVLLLASLSVVGLAGAAGVGTFTIEQTKSADVGQIGVATLYMDNTWQPPADDVWINVTWDGAVLGYISTDWKVNRSVSATLTGTNELFLQFADFTNNYPSGTGKIAVADINFKALAGGSAPLTLAVGHVRSHDASEALDPSLTPPGELTASAVATPGTFQVGGGAVTTVPTVVPTGNATVIPTTGATGLPTPTTNGTIPPPPTAVPGGNNTTVPTGVPTVPPATGVFNQNEPRILTRPGSTVFLGEYNLDIAGLGVSAGDSLVTFDSGANVQTDAPKATKSISNPADFDVTPDTATGPWYIQRAGAVVGTAPVLTVQEPRLDIKVLRANADGTTTDVTGKTVLEGDRLTFRIDSNLGAVAAQRGMGAPVVIRVQDPAGNVYESLYGDQSTAASTSLLIRVDQDVYTLRGLGPNGATWDPANPNYGRGEYKVWAESNLNGMKDNYKDPSGADYTGKTITSQQTVTISDADLTLDANTESVVRNNDFSVIVNGRPASDYRLFIDQPGNNPPRIKQGQVGVNVSAPYTEATVRTDANGKRTVGFATCTTTEATRFTIRVERVEDNQLKYDTVEVEVTAGAVTIQTSGNQSYYLGEEVLITGTNTDAETTYLFITGPNLPSNGANLTYVTEPVGTLFTTARVDADDTWEYRWNTRNLSLDAGSYTIYAVSRPNDRGNLGTAKYATASLVIRKPFLTVNSTSATVARGDELKITGFAEGNPRNLAIWRFGANEFVRDNVSVKDSTYSYTVSRATTRNLATGQYFVVVHHPMYNGQLDIAIGPGGSGAVRVFDPTSGSSFVADGPGRLQGSDAANALVDLINSPTIDDTYTKLTFLVEEPRITINNVTDVNVGEVFDLTGTTNLAVGDDLLVTISSSSFQPTDKSQASGFSGASGATKVVKRDGGNGFNFTVDTTQFQPDTYQVTVESVQAGSSSSSSFVVGEAGAGGNVTPTVTTVGPTVTGNQTVNVTTAAPVTTAGNQTATATPTPTPGFGALVALVGLAAVAVLVLRRE